MITCPCCQGKGEIEERSPVYLSPLQFKIWNTVRCSKHGISGPDLAVKVYAHCEDGGPLCASQSIRVQIKRANARLAEVKQQIKASNRGRGAIYTLRYL